MRSRMYSRRARISVDVKAGRSVNGKMINVDELVGRQVLMMLKPEAFKSLDIQGLSSPKFYATISGFDSFGIWIEDQGFGITAAYDEDGKFIPAPKRKEKVYRAHVLIQWAFIQSMIYIPDRQGMPGAAEDESRIGFIPKRE